MRKARRYFINAFHSFCGSNYYSLQQHEYSRKVVEFTHSKFGACFNQEELDSNILLFVHSLLNFQRFRKQKSIHSQVKGIDNYYTVAKDSNVMWTSFTMKKFGLSSVKSESLAVFDLYLESLPAGPEKV